MTSVTTGQERELAEVRHAIAPTSRSVARATCHQEPELLPENTEGARRLEPPPVGVKSPERGEASHRDRPPDVQDPGPLYEPWGTWRDSASTADWGRGRRVF